MHQNLAIMLWQNSFAVLLSDDRLRIVQLFTTVAQTAAVAIFN